MPGMLLFGDTVRSAALRHEIPLAIIDPVLFAELNGQRFVLTSQLEKDRVIQAIPDAEVLDWFEFGYRDLVQSGMSFGEADREAVVRAVHRIGIDEAIVPGDFPFGLAERLQSAGITLVVDDDAVERRRRAKSSLELEGVRAAQRAAEAGMGAAYEMFSRAQPTDHGQLKLGGELLLAETVRGAVRVACAEQGAPCPPEVIVASVWRGGGHEPGTGPLPSGLPIVVDIWPRQETSACWADMTRTFLAGEPTREHAGLIAAQARLVQRALEQTKAAIRPGITGRELFDAACDLFESAGYLTQRTAQREDELEGFQFSLGHGVGLEVHESPELGMAGSGRDRLITGDVLAIEPGLWDTRIGEIRSEDLVLVTDDGCETLTRFPYHLTPPM